MEPSVAGGARPARSILGLNANVFFLGVVSLLTDISSEMVFTLVPFFLSNVLGVAGTVVGLVGGISESTDAIFRIFSGRLSDKLGRRKLLTVSGYSLSTIAKPFMYLATTWGAVLAVRFSDRVGKGIRSSPRDALVADSVSAEERGRGFGLHRAMDTFGAVLGLITAAVIIYLVQGGALELSLETYRWLVLAGIVPALVAVLVLVAFVREKRTAGRDSSPYPGGSRAGLLAGFDKRFRVFLAVMAIFTLGNSSDFFVILRAQNLGAPLIQVVLMLVLFNVTYTAVSLPAGGAFGPAGQEADHRPGLAGLWPGLPGLRRDFKSVAGMVALCLLRCLLRHRGGRGPCFCG
jgi:MFS family permease